MRQRAEKATAQDVNERAAAEAAETAQREKLERSEAGRRQREFAELRKQERARIASEVEEKRKTKNFLARFTRRRSEINKYKQQQLEERQIDVEIAKATLKHVQKEPGHEGDEIFSDDSYQRLLEWYEKNEPGLNVEAAEFVPGDQTGLPGHEW